MMGELVMEALAMLDQVAFIRSASVYRNFREAKDFGEFVGQITADDDWMHRVTIGSPSGGAGG